MASSSTPAAGTPLQGFGQFGRQRCNAASSLAIFFCMPVAVTSVQDATMTKQEVTAASDRTKLALPASRRASADSNMVATNAQAAAAPEIPMMPNNH